MAVKRETVQNTELATGDIVVVPRVRGPHMVSNVREYHTGRTVLFDLYETKGLDAKKVTTHWMHKGSKVQRLDACWNCVDGRECGVCGRDAR